MSNHDPDPAADLAEWENSYTDGALSSWEAEPARPECFGNWSSDCRGSCPDNDDCWLKAFYFAWLEKQIPGPGEMRRPPSAEEQIGNEPGPNEES